MSENDTEIAEFEEVNQENPYPEQLQNLATQSPTHPIPSNLPVDIPNPQTNVRLIHIRKINIYDSLILTMSHNKNTVHCVLDSGATASLISLKKVQELNLKIWPTIHTAVQVDGISGLKVLGEVHTEFSRGNLTLHFSALVVNKLGTDVLGGTNFLKENDIYSRMAKDTIVIKGNNVFQSTPVQILQMDES